MKTVLKIIFFNTNGVVENKFDFFNLARGYYIPILPMGF